MKLNRKWITFLATVTLSVTLLLFLNLRSINVSHESYYESGKGFPISELLEKFEGETSDKRLEIGPKDIAFIDTNIDVDELVINGQLHCDHKFMQDVYEIKARVIYVNGVFQCGTLQYPIKSNVIISLKPGNVDPRTSPAYRGLVVNSGGKLVLTGEKSRSRWMKLKKTAEPGDTSIEVEFPVDTKENYWRVGDEVVLAPTSYSPNEAETFVISDVRGETLYFDRPLAYRHWGEIQKIDTVHNGVIIHDQRAEVANLNRNILIRADESLGAISNSSVVGAELGGHVMVMPQGSAYIDSVEFYRMGQAGMMARYPFHWHLVGNAKGQFIKNSSIHRSFQRCITVHRTNYSLVQNNVCYDFKGHGYFLEDGVEVENTLTNNLGIGAKFPHLSKVLLASDKSTGGDTSGRFSNVSVFWISHPRNTVTKNVAAGSVGTGFWMAFENEITGYNGNVITRPINEDTQLFASNTAHSTLVGFTWDGAPHGALTGNPNNPEDRALGEAYYKPSTVPVFSGLVAYKNKHSGIYFRGYSAVFDNTVSADNGWHYWLTYNEIVRNSVIIGRSQNHSQYDQNAAITGAIWNRAMQTGIVQYDGPFELKRVDFINYPTQKEMFNGYLDVTAVPVTIIGGTERLTNQSEKVSFTPEPIHRVYMRASSDLASLGIYGNSSLRDLDGTLTNHPGGGLVIAKGSLGVLPTDKCIDGGTTFFSHQICPPNYTESQLHIFMGDGDTNPWAQPFVVRRSDGALSHPLSQWPMVLGLNGWVKRAGNKVAYANSTGVSYDLMLKTVNPLLWIASERLDIKVPVTRVVGYGKNCSLSNAPAVSSLKELENSSESAYYTNEDELYFRLVPKKLFHFIVYPNPHATALRYTSDQHYIHCQGAPTPYIKGNIDSVRLYSSKSGTQLLVEGWGCNFSKDENINVKLYIGGPKGGRGSQYIKTAVANVSSDEKMAFDCGVPGVKGYKYQIYTPTDSISHLSGQKVYVYGESPTDLVESPLSKSGYYSVPRIKLVPIEVVEPVFK